MAIICNYHQVVAVKEILAVTEVLAVMEVLAGKEVSVEACISLLKEQKFVEPIK